MSTPIVLIATAKPRPEDIDAFTAWQGHYVAAAATFPGFLSSDLVPPTELGHVEWTLLLTFETAAQLNQWEQSSERAALIAAGACEPVIQSIERFQRPPGLGMRVL